MVLSINELVHGFSLAVEATQFAARHKRVQAKFVDVLKITVIGMAIAHVVIYGLVFFPLFLLQAGNSAFATLLQYDSTQSTLALLSTRGAVEHFLDMLPLLGLDIITHVRPAVFASIFFAMLSEIDPEYSDALKSWPPRRFRWAKIKFAIQRLSRRYLMTLGASLLSRVPYVGWVVVPAGTVSVMAKFVGYPLSGAVVVLSVIAPDSKRTMFFVFKSLLAMSDFSRDLLKPYFSHLGAKPRQQVAFYRANESTIIGFILAFYFFVQLSWVGPAFFILAQAAIALFIVRQTPRPPMYTPGATWQLTQDKEEPKEL
ncbi:hypothetical protein LPJ63_002635 [Coemansia sp. RSA 2711]|nr:hypothetical protein LPJ63_002635 [Coemansia sp. RSA 2711]KAJ2311309.1 hypothetical protein IWW52_005171 [Coemansia sp. RSA 2704]KAJ2322618.1 hypothetical protein IWW51_004147 [Coemansia sp. RSA 2702]KAJ2363400.1 hypothetical protein H4S01_004325 [Coemansia sp. RSA 2610]